MIAELRLRNFKCFPEIDLRLAALTVLSGGNGAGKSSVLEALILARDVAAALGADVALTTNRLDLGTFSSVLSTDARGADIDIALEFTDGSQAMWRLGRSGASPEDERGRRQGRPNMATIVGRNIDEAANEHPPVADRFVFIHAERVGPRAAFDLSANGLAGLGARGENLAGFLTERGGQPVSLRRTHRLEGDRHELRSEAEAWLGEFAPGIGIELVPYPDLGVASLGFTFPTPMGRVGPHRATHTGFGLTYVLPVILAVLSSNKGDLVLLQNPEAHLHPRAQRRLTELLVLAAADGVQIVVETHSDHIINGVRLGVKREQLAKENVRFYHFETDRNGGGHTHSEPIIDDNGLLDHWPDGFFDEWDRALRDLVGPSQIEPQGE